MARGIDRLRELGTIILSPYWQHNNLELSEFQARCSLYGANHSFRDEVSQLDSRVHEYCRNYQSKLNELRNLREKLFPA